MGGLGIDLGTANTVVCHSIRGIILDEPTIMVFRMGGGRRRKVIAVGQDARALLGRTPAGLAVVRPLQDAVVSDLEIARTFIAAVLRRLPIHAWERARLRAVIGVPVGACGVQPHRLLRLGPFDFRRVHPSLIEHAPLHGRRPSRPAPGLGTSFDRLLTPLILTTVRVAHKVATRGPLFDQAALRFA